MNNKNIIKAIQEFKNLKILVIGDSIVDKYTYCDTFNALKVEKLYDEVFLGGAGIVASHSASCGARVDFFTILGDDDNADIIKNKLNKYNVNAHICTDNSRNTLIKQRFKKNNKLLFQVNTCKKQDISTDIQNEIFTDIQKIIQGKDLLIFSDFSYGLLPKELIQKITNLATKNKVIVTADAQSSSQKGDITKFKNISLITPTKKEAQNGMNDFTSSLPLLAKKISFEQNIDNVCITLGKEGAFIYNKKLKQGEYIKALNANPVDTIGAGDCFFVFTSMSLALNQDLQTSSYIGSVGASLQVGINGNIPLDLQDLQNKFLT